MPKVTVLPANLSVEAEPGETLLRAGERAGVPMEAGCFNCFCGTCLVEVLKGRENLTDPSDEELEVLDQWNKDPDRFRLGCAATVKGPGDVVLRAGHE